MSAASIGILAGGGPLPAQVAEAIEATGGSVFIVGFQDFVDVAQIAHWPHRVVRLAAAGELLTALRTAGCRDIVLIGPVKRPALRDLRPDAEGARIMARIGRALFPATMDCWVLWCAYLARKVFASAGRMSS